MRSLILSTAVLVALAAPALADTYPVFGRWGQSASTQKGPIECHGRRVITFSGNQRRDSDGGVPSYRNLSVTPDERAHFRIVDEFTTGQISSGRVYYTLVVSDADNIMLQFQQGGTLTLQRCK